MCVSERESAQLVILRGVNISKTEDGNPRRYRESMRKPLVPCVVVVCLTAAGLTVIQAQTSNHPADEHKYLVDHSDCTFLGAKREVFQKAALKAIGAKMEESPVSVLTRQVTANLSVHPVARTRSYNVQPAADSIDYYILNAMQAAGITPADDTNDYEFIRRVTLDLTGRIPVASRVTSFVADSTPNKRAKLIDDLLASSAWVDKWTMYYGDLYQNNTASQQLTRFQEGRNAFYKYIHDSLAANKPYNQMVTEMISAQAAYPACGQAQCNFDQTNGQVNWVIGGRVTGGPAQDIFDQQAVNTAEQFLGITHMNCVLCHNGAGHLDSLSLWGSKTTRYQAWGLSAFFSRTSLQTTYIIDPANPQNKNNYYWWTGTYNSDYNLNTTTGNRPARQPIGGVKTITPAYLFTAQTPNKGEDYRAALARFVTGDFQFARATVNYMWAYFFGQGIVDPPDQFDLMRLDPNNPPPAPWVIQPSNPQLLNALAQHFVSSGYDLKALMREIVNSETYQLASDYNGTWQASYQPYFARKFVRRLWSEEVHDAITTATGVLPSYNIGSFSSASTKYGVNSPGFGLVSYAMQFPETKGMPDGTGGAVSQFLDVFFRGDRDLNPRRQDGSILQALGLMNDKFIDQRINGPIATQGVNPNLTLAQNIDKIFMAVLSRHPTSDELTDVTKRASAVGATPALDDLWWSLFNKVDFVFNY